MLSRRTYKAAFITLAVGILLAVGAGLASAAPLFMLTGDLAEADLARDTVTDVSSTFKRVYAKAVDAVPDSTPLTAQLNRTSEIRGAAGDIFFNVKLETGGATANVPEGKQLPAASRPKRRKGKAGLAHTYTVVGVGGQSIKLTQSSRNAFVELLQDQLSDGMQRVSNDVERQYNGDGQGILCLLETVGSAPTYDVHQPYGLSNGGPGTMLMIEEMQVACVNPSNGNERDRAEVTDVDVANEQITVDSSFSGASTGDYLVLCNDASLATGNSDAVNNYQSEANGLLAVIGEQDTFENIDGSSHRRWNATVMDNSGTLRDVQEKLIRTLEARVKAKSGQGRDGLIHYTSHGISIELQSQLAGLRRYEGEQHDLSGGYTGVDIAGRPVIESEWCPKGHWFAFNTDEDAVAMVDVVEMGYIDLDGAELHRVSGRHAYRADLWFPHQCLWFARNRHGVLKDLNDDDSIVR